MNYPSAPVENHYAYCPRCASPAASPRTVPFRCQGCGFSQFFGPVAAVGALIVNERSELLLVRRSRDPGKGQWGLPGGFVDRDETIEQALAREIIEETQLVITDCQLILTGPNKYDYHGVVSPVIDLFYLCKVADMNAILLAEDELDSFVWTRPGPEYLQNMAFESNLKAVQHWMRGTESAGESQ